MTTENQNERKARQQADGKEFARRSTAFDDMNDRLDALRKAPARPTVSRIDVLDAIRDAETFHRQKGGWKPENVEKATKYKALRTAIMAGVEIAE